MNEPLSPENVVAQFATQRAKEAQVGRLVARGSRFVSIGIALTALGAVGGMVVGPGAMETVVYVAAGLGGLSVLFGAFLLFGAFSVSRRR